MDNIENNTDDGQDFRCGYIAIVGRPNVGKSTLLNAILEMHLSITSKKPQTTRHRILGVKTTDSTQSIYVDTPGIHQDRKGAIHRYMNREASSSLQDVDVVAFVIEALRFKEEDEYVLSLLEHVKAPVVLVVNKVDEVADKEALLPFLKETQQRYDFADVIPLSATKMTNVIQFEELVSGYLPQSAPFFPDDQVTDRSQRFMAAELVREKVMRLLGQEIPYAITVEIDAFECDEKICKISAIIWVERDKQKGIVIGSKGSKLKEIGRDARLAMEQLFDTKVYLNVWVKVKEGWSNDERALHSLGYHDND